ncbi:AraC family transcriptional regulator [Leptospira gomenensis]|uniref:AraC family transcriptional regulator n=1 Tax=Leptospira gomenensis TaxID=2484974 RepID=UPI001FE5C1DD|nr:helix-turn-helix domain-containing protein [Leptospira gomenensis]
MYFLFWMGIFGSSLGCLMFFGQIVLPHKSRLNYLLGILFLGMSVLQAGSILLLNGKLPSFSWFVFLHIPVLYSVGPVLYGIHRISVGEIFPVSIRDVLVHASFPSAGLLAYAWISFVFPHFFFDPIPLIETAFVKRIFPGPLDWVLGPAFVEIGGYVILVLKNSRDLWRWEVWKNEPTARILSFLVIVTVIHLSLGFCFLTTKRGEFLILAAGGMGISLCAAYLIGHRYPGFFQKLQEVTRATKAKYARSLLVGIDRDVLKENLLQLMEKEFFYRNEDLSLGDLADELALSTHQISEFLNQELGKSFSVFVNDYRITEACKLLAEEPNTNVLDIAYSVGFRTKSSFNRAFQKITGLTPSEYRTKAASKN